MKLNKSIFLKILNIITVLLSFVFVSFNFDLFFISPFLKNYKINSLNFVAFGEDGSKILNNDSGLTLLKINNKNEIVFFKKAGVELVEDFKSSYGHCVDDLGNMYVYDLELTSGQKIKQESILKFNEKGHLTKKIFKNECETKDNKGIANIFIFKDEFYYIYKDENIFYIKDSLNEIVKKYSFDTKNSLCYGIIDLDNVVVLTKDGYFYKLNISGNEEIIYNSNIEKDSIPFYFSILEDQSLIYTDIGKREISIIKNDFTKKENILNFDDDFLDRPIYMWIEAKGNLDNFKIIATDGTHVLNYSSNESNFELLDNFKFSKKFLIKYIAFLIFSIILSLYLIYILIFIFKKISLSKSFVTKISALVIVGTIIITGIFCIISFESFNTRIISEVKKRESVVSLLISGNLPYDKIESIVSNSQFNTPEYSSISKTINDIFEKHKSVTDGFYCVIYKLTHNDNVVSVLYDMNATYPTITPSYNYEEGSIEEQLMRTKEGFVSEPEIWPTGYFVYSYNPIINNKGNCIGIIEVGTNINALTEENNKLILTLFLNIVSMAIFIILLVLEILIFIREREEKLKILDKKSNISMSSGMSRLLVFLIYFTTCIVSGFSSLYAFGMIPEDSVISKEFLAGIPLSAEILLSLISIIFTKILIKIIGKRKTAFLFSMFFCVGMFLKIIPNIWVFTIANSICGFGWGGILRIVSSLLSETNKIEDFNGNDSSMLSGITCALVFGSFLINFIDYFSIFLISALLGLLVFYFVILYVKDENNKNLNKIIKNDKIKLNKILKFLISPKVLIYFILVLIPMSICDYFIAYFFPITADYMGLKETHIGYACIANRLCSIIFGNVIVNYLSNRVKDSYVLFMYMILFSISMIIFAKFQTLAVLIFSVIIIGLFNSFGYSYLSDYFINIKTVKDFGADMALSISTFIANISYMLAPFIFGFIINKDIKIGLFTLSFTIIIFSIIFLIFNFKKEKLAKNFN